MTCVILAAGYATRLYPLTEHFPKPLLPVRGKPILDWLIEDIDTAGVVEEYIVVTNHKFAPQFVAWAADKPRVTVVDDGTETNETRLGAVRDMQLAIADVKGDVLVIAGDNLLDFSLTRFIAYARKKRASCMLRYYEPSRQKLLKCGVVTVESDDRVVHMTEKSPQPATPWCCPPFYYYIGRDVARVAEALADGCGADAPGGFAAWLCQRSTVYAMEMPGKRYDIGTLESYQNVCDTFQGVTKT